MTTKTDEDASAEDTIVYVALTLGFNHLRRSSKSIGERLYYSMMRDKSKELAIEGGAKFKDTSDAAGNDTMIELQRIGINLTRDDLPALRAAVAELEAQ